MPYNIVNEACGITLEALMIIEELLAFIKRLFEITHSLGYWM